MNPSTRIEDIFTRLKRLSIGVGVLMIGLTLLFGLGSVSVYAQASSGTFRACNFEAAETARTSEESGTAFEECLGEIFEFIVVLAILLILFRIALSALKAYNPLDGGGSATNNAVTIVWDIVLGLLFIGGPYLILTTLNPALTNFDITDLSGIFDNIDAGQSQNGSGGSGSGGGGSGSTGGEDTGDETSAGGGTSAEIDEAVQQILAENGYLADGSQVTLEQEQEAVERLQDDVRLYYRCHYYLLDNNTSSFGNREGRQDECEEWRGLSNKTRVLSARDAIENSDSRYKENFNSSADNQDYDLGKGPYYVQENSVAFAADTLLPYPEFGTGCSRYYLDVQAANVDDSLPRLDAVGGNTLRDRTFYTLICSRDSTNPYFDQADDGTWTIKPNLSFGKDANLDNLERVNRQ